MSFDLNLINDIDPETIEAESTGGARYPLIQWGYGSPKLAAKLGGIEGNGGFFLPENKLACDEEKLKAALVQHGWVADNVTYESGQKNPGYYIDTLTFSLVNYRERWEVKDGDKNFYYPFDWKAWNDAKEKHGKNPKSRIHLYVIIKGLEDFGPFVITLGGTAAMAFKGTKKNAGALSTFEETVKAAAKTLTNKVWPNRAFWLTLTTNKDAKGNAVFIKTGDGKDSTYVCVPVAMGLPEPKSFADSIKNKTVDLHAFLDKFSIQRDVFTYIQNLYTDSAEWKAQWNAFASNEADAPAAQAKAEPVKEYEVAGL